MAGDRPDPGEFFDLVQRWLRELIGDPRSDEEPWAEVTRAARERAGTSQGKRELSAERQRENLTSTLATRAVEALEDLALDVAAIRQRLERTGPQTSAPPAENHGRGPEATDAAGQ